MPPRPPLPQTVRIAIYSTNNNEVPIRNAANIMYCQFTPALTPTAAELVTLAGAAQSRWGARFSPFMNITSNVIQAVATLIDGSETQGISTTPPVQGTGASGDMPDNTAACISWPIGVAYRGGHPRSYLFGLDRSVLDSGPSTNKLSTASAAAIATAGTNFITDLAGTSIGGSSVVIGTVSYVRAKAPRVTPVFFAYGAAVRVNTRLASQRRRLGKLSTGVYEL